MQHGRCSQRCTDGSARGLIPSICKKLKHCWSSSYERGTPRESTTRDGRETTRAAPYGQVRYSLHCWLDILVDAKQVGRIVQVLDGHQPLIVVAIGGFDPLFTLIHHKIHICAPR